MDRREALKKLGAGGAAVVGVSVIVSTPAFAFNDPTVTGGAPTTFSLTVTKNREATIAASGFPSSPPNVNCPASATSGPTLGVPTFSWQIIDNNSGTGPTVTKSSNWANGDVVNVTVFVEYTCTRALESSSRVFRWTRSFVKIGNWPSTTVNAGSINGPFSVP